MKVAIGDGVSSGMSASTYIYKDRFGRIRSPKRSPYHCIEFRPTVSTASYKLESQWLVASAHIAAAMDLLKEGGPVAFDPSVTDVRAWQWRGYKAEARYTYGLAFPFELTSASNAVRKNVKKAERSKYTCERANDFDGVISCLKASEVRQGFSYGITGQNLRRLHDLMTDDNLRLYVCRDAAGAAVSSRVVLHGNESKAVDWLAGSVSSHLTQGVTQLLLRFVLEDLQQAGARGFDYGGANIPSVAKSKSEWGGDLLPFIVLKRRSLVSVGQEAQSWLKTRITNRRARLDVAGR